jgi:hypothetical protein
MSYKDRIKCFFGFHDWEYSSWEDEVDTFYVHNIDYLIERQYHFPSRFCQCCFKKQRRQIVDLGRTILWINTDKLTSKEIRQKKLKKLLDEY